MTPEEIIADLLAVMQDAVDGSCDTSMAVDRAEDYLKENGYYKLDGYWFVHKQEQK